MVLILYTTIFCTIGIIFVCAIKTDEICVCCFKFAQNFVMPGARLIWHCATLVKFSASAYWAEYGKTLISRAKSWSWLIRQAGLVGK